MLGFSPKLPVSIEERLWVDEGFVRLETMLGRKRLLEEWLRRSHTNLGI